MNSIFYQGNRVISGDFKGERTTSDGSVILLEKIERNTKCILRYCNRLFDRPKRECPKDCVNRNQVGL